MLWILLLSFLINASDLQFGTVSQLTIMRTISTSFPIYKRVVTVGSKKERNPPCENARIGIQGKFFYYVLVLF